MTKLHVVVGGCAVVAMFALVGCGKNKAVAATEELADKVCACKDAECVKRETETYSKKRDELKDEKGSEADAKAMEDAYKKALDCAQAKGAAKAPAGATGEQGDKK